MPPVNAGRSPRACFASEPRVVVMFGTPCAEQVRMQVEMPSDDVEVTLESLVSSGEREAGARGAFVSEPADALKG